MAVAVTRAAEQGVQDLRPVDWAKQDPIADFTKEQEFHALRQMLLIRRFEEKAGQMYGMGLIGGFCHLYIGQEAVVVGMQMAIERGRSGHHRLSRSRPHARLRHGPERRHGGTHRPARRLFQGQGRLDAHVLACEKNFYRRPRHRRRAGAARHRARLRQPISRQRQRVCLTYFGDGAANQGQVYESFNMAELWKLPVVYVIENNRYAMGTSVHALVGADRFLQARPVLQHSGRAGRRHGRARGEGRGRKGASTWCRAGKGPIILEMLTYRYRGHSMSDPAKYRHQRRSRQGAHRARSDRAGARSGCSQTSGRARTS